MAAFGRSAIRLVPPQAGRSRPAVRHAPSIDAFDLKHARGVAERHVGRDARFLLQHLVDGVRDSAHYSRSDTFDLEQIEVVNGANSVFGGSYNF